MMRAKNPHGLVLTLKMLNSKMAAMPCVLSLLVTVIWGRNGCQGPGKSKSFFTAKHRALGTCPLVSPVLVTCPVGVKC